MSLFFKHKKNLSEKPASKKPSKEKTCSMPEHQVIFDSSPIWIFYKDKKNCFLKVNQAFANAVGLPKEKLEGRSCFELFSKDQADSFWRDDLEVIESGKSKKNIVETINSAKKNFWVRSDKIPYKDKKGNIIGVIGFAIDITESRKAEEEIHRGEGYKKKSEEFSQSRKALLNILEDVEAAGADLARERDKTLAIISNIYTPIIVVDKSNKVMLFNSSAEKFLGLKSGDLGQRISNKNNFNLQNFKPIIRNKINSYKLQESESLNLMTEELRVDYKEEELVYKVITSKVVGEDEEYLGVMKIFYDLTREAEIDRLKSEFVSIAAHQLRTPLSAIKWVIKMVMDGDAGKLNKEQEELLYRGYKSNERIIKLVDDLLDVSRIEEGRFGFNFKYSDFLEILNTVVENVSVIVAKNHLKLSVEKPEKLPKIYMDPSRIILVFQNIVDNATKYTPQSGHIKIKLSFSDDNKFLQVSVKDQGVGIPEADQVKLFTKFFRAENAVRLQTEGTGLGLFIAKNIIEKHGGSININSEEGKGTEVYFNLPISKKSATKK